MSSIVKRSARAILIDSDGHLLLIRRSKDGQEPYWTAPGGGVEADDVTVEQAVVRELREELGAEIDAVQQVFLVSSPVQGGGTSVQHFFVCRLETIDLGLRSGPEFAESGRGAYDLDRIDVGADGTIGVDLKPAELKAFVEANWLALRDAVGPSAATADC